MRGVRARALANRPSTLPIPPAVEIDRTIKDGFIVADKTTHHCAYMNHSCNPNVAVAVLEGFEGATFPIVVMYAARKIRDQVELGFRYSTPNAVQLAQACACGAPACCGLLGCDKKTCLARVKAAAGRKGKGKKA